MPLTKSEVPLLTIGQRNFIRGLNAASPVYDQPKGTLPRLSNWLLTKRGGLVLCDGSKILSAYNGSPSTDGPWLEIILFAPTTVSNYLMGLLKDANNPLATPSAPTVTDGGSGGLLTGGLQEWVITALDGAGGETVPSTNTNFTIPNLHKANVSWTAVSGASAYNIYRKPVGGSFFQYSGTSTTTSYVDNIADANLGVTAPITGTTAPTNLYIIPPGSFNASNIVASFPATALPVLGGIIGAYGGSPGGTGGSGVNSCGGVLGQVGPLPLMLQFSNKVIICLGNGLTPWYYPDGGPATVIGNTFQATYPNWVASTTYLQGDIILPLTNNPGGYVFTCIQAGVSGTSNPTFPQTKGTTVTDQGGGTTSGVIWQNSGTTTTSPAPRGAAHALVYAGSLWLANTSPTTTTDSLDGPTVLKMSDINNPNSWNPLNIAFVGKDDGTQITGLAAYTIAETGIAPTGSMVVYKDFETYQVIGVFGATDFAIQKAQTDMGNIAPRSIQFLSGYGITRLAHLGVAIFDGVRDRLVSEEIRPYLFGGESDINPIDWGFAYLSKGAQTANPPMYALAVPTTSLTSLTSANILSGVTNFTSATAWTPGTYYFKATALVNGVEVAVSPEFGPFTIPTGNRPIVTVSGPILDGLSATSWRIYWGTSSNQEGQYAEVPYTIGVGPVAVNLNQSGTPGSPGSMGGGLTRLLCYDMVLKAWAIIDLPWPIMVLKQIRATGTIPITITGSFNDSSVRRIQAGDNSWDGNTITATVRSPEVFGKYANQSLYLRRLTIRGYFLTDFPTQDFAYRIAMTITYDGITQLVQYGHFYQQGKRFELVLDLGQLSRSVHVDLTAIVGQLNFPVEIDEFDWEAGPRIPGVPLSI